MGLIVQKFGGTSVADTTRIKNIVNLIQEELALNNQVVVIVSAMAGVTNHLITLCNEVSRLDDNSKLQEYDAAISSGEIVTAALLALSLQEKNVKARSFAAWQLPLYTTNSFSQTSALTYNTINLIEALKAGVIPIITGFQGIDKDSRITTLGRGGSDITAVLTAAALKAERCDIYTDVDGVFTADPRVVHSAKPLREISYEQMLELAASGAKVLHPRAIELSMRYNVDIRVLSSFTKIWATSIISKHEIMENKLITGITSNKNLLKVVIENSNLSFSKLCMLMTKNSIQLNFMHITEVEKSYNFIASLSDKNKFEILLNELKEKQQIKSFSFYNDIGTVSVIGYGIKADSNVLYNIIEKLEQSNITFERIETSEIKISLLMNDRYIEKAINLLHELVE